MQKVDELIMEARTWVGTPFRHQGRVKGVGVDCANLVLAVGEAAGVMAPDWFARMRKYHGYRRTPDPTKMRAALEEFLVEITDPRVGDVAWIEWSKDVPMHLAILADGKDRTMIIHAFAPLRKVIEHGFTEDWQAKVNSWWRYPGVE